MQCQEYFEACHIQFEKFFQSQNQELIEHLIELKLLRERHAEISHAVKKVRDSISAELGLIRAGMFNKLISIRILCKALD